MSLRHAGPHFSKAPPSLEAANQAQIDDLVQRNRTLEHTIKKLTDQVSHEQARTRDAVLEIQAKWDANQKLWKEGCEAVLSSYRIVQKKLQVEVETERAAVIREMAITREEKLLRVQRDVKITRFQMREQELERRVEEMEEERAEFAEEMQRELQAEKEKSAAYLAKLKETRESNKLQLAEVRNALRIAKQERDAKDAEVVDLTAKNAVLENEIKSLETKFQRTTLNMEALQNKLSDADRLADELKREKASLSNQLERWQSLENKEGEAAEQQRKQIVALELELREIKEAYEHDTEKAARDLEKAHNRLQRTKDALAELESQSNNHEEENESLKKQMAKLQKANEKLKADIEEERSRIRPSPIQKSRKPTSPPPMEVDDDEIEEIEEEEPVAASKKASSKATSSKAREDQDKPSKNQRQIARKSTGGMPPRRKKPPTTTTTTTPDDDPDIVEISEHEMEQPAPTTKRKGKAKAVEREHAEDEDAAAATAAAVPRNSKGKRKATEQNDADIPQIVEKPKGSKKSSRAPSEAREAPAAKPNKARRAGSKQPVSRADTDREEKDGEDDDGDDEKVPKKKKRKLIPLAANVGPFAFNTLNLAQVDDALGIPSVLSPLKQDERVPQRSMSSSLVNSIFTKNALSRK
ncbi:hypothetical protein JR316_0005903 [Psilocybe cubensis]|uniref:Uncharacterized protein n=2 Tax=Psilocybe cubensis TaxID=181762 RepID=A0ACB8H0R3_PSICU|nr:hypothetical protein JR316_0005903 [Psilocybe cubensis]KAH9481378.1 hypothetical protein JR316_0005903 [Psilocybe cubensis]